MSLFVSPWPFWPPPFPLSLSLSLSFFPSSFLLFFGFFYFFVSSLFLFHEKNNIKFFNSKVFCSSTLSYFLVFCLVFSFKSLFLVLVFFPNFKLCFYQHECFWFQNKQLQKHKLLVGRGLQPNVFLLTCVLQNVKSYRFGGPVFWANFG